MIANERAYATFEDDQMILPPEKPRLEQITVCRLKSSKKKEADEEDIYIIKRWIIANNIVCNLNSLILHH
jgi:hypothetical protein